MAIIRYQLMKDTIHHVISKVRFMSESMNSSFPTCIYYCIFLYKVKIKGFFELKTEVKSHKVGGEKKMGYAYLVSNVGHLSLTNMNNKYINLSPLRSVFCMKNVCILVFLLSF